MSEELILLSVDYNWHQVNTGDEAYEEYASHTVGKNGVESMNCSATEGVNEYIQVNFADGRVELIFNPNKLYLYPKKPADVRCENEGESSIFSTITNTAGMATKRTKITCGVCPTCKKYGDNLTTTYMEIKKDA